MVFSTTTAAATAVRVRARRHCGPPFRFENLGSFDEISVLCKQGLCKHCRRKCGGFPKLIQVEEKALTVLLRALGQRIRELRSAQGYSQEGFADKCGVHRTFMGTVERGESNLSFQNIAKVATTLGVSLAELFSDLENRARNMAAQAAATAGRPARKKTSGQAAKK